jgi:glycosyltransferase involved in cell wall biosynthesis
MVSIVTAYNNRWSLFEFTLKTIQKSKYTDFELIVVDDCSDDANRLEEKLKNYNFKTTLIRLDKKNKFYTNPCIPFNIGFEYVCGDTILIQNPECFHMGQVLQKASTIKNNDYLVFSCYNLDKHLSEKIRIENEKEIDFNNINQNLIPLINRPVAHCEETAWYNHPIYRDTKMHFACAIKKSDLDDLGGFDENYSFAVAYDDNDLVARILKKKMNVFYSTVPIVIHQWHGLGNYTEHHPILSQLFQDFNRTLFEKYTSRVPEYRVENKKGLSKMVPRIVTKLNQ